MNNDTQFVNEALQIMEVWWKRSGMKIAKKGTLANCIWQKTWNFATLLLNFLYLCKFSISKFYVIYEHSLIVIWAKLLPSSLAAFLIQSPGAA